MENYNSILEKIIEINKTKLLLSLRFFAQGMQKLPWKQHSENYLFATDAQSIQYNPDLLIKTFRDNPNYICRSYIHILLHCLIGHPFVKNVQNKRIWNLASDIAAEGLVLSMQTEWKLPEDEERQQNYDRLIDYARSNTAQGLYNYFIHNYNIHSGVVDDERIVKLEELFRMDCHDLWYNEEVVNGRRKVERKPGDKLELSEEDDSENVQMQNAESDMEQPEVDISEQLKKEWEQVAKKVQEDMEFTYKRHGTRAGVFLKELGKINKKDTDYKNFLREFASYNEVMKISDDEFDVAYYTYGLELYNNIPLIEPLEYREDRNLKEFAIAIDTSASVQGELVHTFVEHTFSILSKMDYFSSRRKIYVLLCDCQVQKVLEIKDLHDVDKIFSDFQVSGYGGTDFTPVFDYLNNQIAEKKIDKLDGLIYFTDGIGVYPDDAPEYKTAFVFYQDDKTLPEVPAWAMKTVMTSDGIRILDEIED